MKNLCLLMLLCVGMHASAETLEETVKRFEAMGMPSVAGAEFACLSEGAWELGIIDLGGGKNAWKLSEEERDGKRTATFVVNGGEILQMAWGNARVFGKVDPDEEVRGKWEKARLRRAALKIMEALDSKTSIPGQTFLFAMQLHQYGETEDAEALAGHVVAMFGAEEIERAARNALSAALYRTAYWRFRDHRDWGRFHEDVQKVMEGSHESWGWRPDLRELLTRLDYLARGEMTPLPHGYDFSEEERILIKALEIIPQPYANPAPGIYYGSWRDTVQPLWAIPETWVGKEMLAPKVEHDIRAMGMKAFPMLIALCDDFPQQKAVRHVAPFDTYLDGRRSEQDTGALPFPHPELRSEKARRILQNTLPYALLEGKAKSIHDAVPTIKEIASAFYESHKDSAPATLALQYMLFPQQNAINDTAFDYLLTLAQTEPIPELETFFMNINDDTNSSWGILSHSLVGYAICYAAYRNNKDILNDYAGRFDALADQYEAKFMDEEALRKREEHLRNSLFRLSEEELQRAVNYPNENAKKAQEELRGDAVKLRAMTLPISDEALWRTFETAEECKEISFADRQSGFPLVTVLLERQLNAMPLNERIATVLRRAPSNPRRYHSLIWRHILREGGVRKAKETMALSDAPDAWRAVAEASEAWRSFYELYGSVFEDDFWAMDTQARSHLEDPEERRAFWKERLLARLDNLPLPPFPWDTSTHH